MIMGIILSGHFSRHFIMSSEAETILRSRNKSIDLSHIYPEKIIPKRFNKHWEVCYCGGYVSIYNPSYKRIHLKSSTHIDWVNKIK
jgi:hypothetical protein